MSVPLLVAAVFGATFLVVCAVAWVVLGRRSSIAEAVPAPAPELAPTPAPAPLPPSSAFPLEMPQSGSFAIESIRSTGGQERTSNTTMLRFYRMLMFGTGGVGILASYLMFSAVEEISRLLFIGIAVFLGSCVAIYRGFVPDRELTRKK